jgi:hypothetical protein
VPSATVSLECFRYTKFGLKIKLLVHSPYCQGIRRIRIGIPGNSANIRRGILRYLPEYFRNSDFWPLVTRAVKFASWLFIFNLIFGHFRWSKNYVVWVKTDLKVVELAWSSIGKFYYGPISQKKVCRFLENPKSSTFSKASKINSKRNSTKENLITENKHFANYKKIII